MNNMNNMNNMDIVKNSKEIDYTYRFSINLWSLIGLIVVCKTIVSIYKINKSYTDSKSINLINKTSYINDDDTNINDKYIINDDDKDINDDDKDR